MKSRSLIQFINPHVGGVDISVGPTKEDKDVTLFIEFAKPLGNSGKTGVNGQPLVAYGWSSKDKNTKELNTIKLQLSFKEIVRLSTSIDKMQSDYRIEHPTGNINPKYINVKFSEDKNNIKQLTLTATKIIDEGTSKRNISSGYYFKGEELASLNYILKSFLFNYVNLTVNLHNNE